jgi:hypothetical protein
MFLSTHAGPSRSAPAVNGWVGDVLRNASCFTGRSSTGSTGFPVSRSRKNGTPSVRIAISTLRGRPPIVVS